MSSHVLQSNENNRFPHEPIFGEKNLMKMMTLIGRFPVRKRLKTWTLLPQSKGYSSWTNFGWKKFDETDDRNRTISSSKTLKNVDFVATE